MKFIIADRPAWMKKRGILGFQDNTPGEVGWGVPAYANTPGYMASPEPRVVGARFFCGEACGTHPTSSEIRHGADQGPPDVVGNFIKAPKAAYAQAVEDHNATDDKPHRRVAKGKGVT